MTLPPRQNSFTARTLLFLLLAGLGFAGNLLRFPLFYGIDFIFGSVPALVAAYLMGPLWGGLVALVAGSYTYVLWGHPYAWIILVGEAVFVGAFLRRRRGDVLLPVGIYWVSFGIALDILFYHYFRGQDLSGVTLAWLRQSVNGVFNGLIAALIVTYTPVRAWTGREEDRTPSLRQVLFNLFVALVLFPALLLVFFDGRREVGQVRDEMQSRLLTTSHDVQNHLRFWIDTHRSAVSRLADRARRERLSAERLKGDLQLLKGISPDFDFLRLTDDHGRVIAAYPERNRHGERIVGMDISKRPYFPAIAAARETVFSNAYEGRDGAPTVAVGEAVLLKGRFAGAALGSVDLGYLDGALKGYSDPNRLWVNLVDARGRAVAATQPGLKPLQPFRFGAGGAVHWNDSSGFQWQPDPRGRTFLTRWRETLYGRKLPLPGVSWSLIVLAPVKPYQDDLQPRYVNRLAILLGLSLLSMALAHLLASRLAGPLVRLSAETMDLPDRLREGDVQSGMTWPDSSVRETAALVSNFRAMSGTLQGQFRDAQTANETLEDQARELTRTNEELLRRARLAACGEEVSNLVARGEDLPSILQGSAEALVRHLEVPFARIWVLDAEENALILRASAGLYTHLDGAHRRMIVGGEKKIGKVAQERKPFVCNDIVRDMEYLDRDWAREHRLVAFAGYPLMVENRSIGVMAMFSGKPIPEATVSELSTLADGVAQCIERKRAEAYRRADERRFRALIEESSDAIALIDENGTALYASPSTQRILGYTQEEAVGMDVFQGMEPDDHERIRPDIEWMLQNPRSRITTQYRYHHKDGSIRWLEAVTTNLLDEPSVGAVVSNYRDVTDRKNLEDRLQQRALELAEANRRKDDFLAMLAHELRNPLGPVMNALYLMRKGGGEMQERAREVIDRQVRHMARLMDDLLDVSRITRGKVEVRREPLDLAGLARNGAHDHRSLMESLGVSLVMEAPESPVWVEGDATRLSQVIGNLLINASKFTEAGGRVTLRLREAEGDAELSVEDTGIGIEPDLLPHIFDTFTQADRSLDRSRGGLGLGLALVKGLVGLHGGEARAYSEGLGHGAAFTVVLPLAKPPSETAEAGEKKVETSAPLRILVIEDHPDAAESLSEMLQLMGHEAEVALTGPEGLMKARKCPPDVVLCDLGLPGMDGYTVGAVLRKEFGAMGLVAISGYGREEDRRRSRSVGFDRHLVKPVDPDELRRVLGNGKLGNGGVGE